MICYKIIDVISITNCKTAVTPLLTRWSYCSLALSHQYICLLCVHSAIFRTAGVCVVRHNMQLTWLNWLRCFEFWGLSMRWAELNQHQIGGYVLAHYINVIIGAMTSEITSLTFVFSTVYSGANQRKHQRSPSLAFVRGIHWWPVNSPHKGPVTGKMFPFADVIMNCTHTNLCGVCIYPYPNFKAV